MKPRGREVTVEAASRARSEMRSAPTEITPRKPSPRRSRWRAALVVVVVGVVTASAAADAVAAPPIRAPRIRVAPPVHTPLPRVSQDEILGAAGSSAKYGDDDAPFETRLDDLRSDADRQVAEDVEVTGKTRTAREAVRTCVSDGVQAAAEDYGQALVDYATTGTHEFPGVYQSFGQAAYACIESQTGAPPEVVEPVAEYLAGHLHEQFVTVANTTASGPAQQAWLELLATDVAASDVAASDDTPAEPPSASTSSEDTPVALIAGVAGGLALLTLVVAIAMRSRRGT